MIKQVDLIKHLTWMSFFWKLVHRLYFTLAFTMTTMMMNCFCGVVDRRKGLRLNSSRDHCQRFSPSQISDSPRVVFKSSQNHPVDTGRRLNVSRTFRRCPGRLLNVLCTLDLCPVSTGQSSGFFEWSCTAAITTSVHHGSTKPLHKNLFSSTQNLYTFTNWIFTF